VYLFDGSGSEAYYVSGTPGLYRRLEVETGSAFRPWLPLWTWRYNGDRFVVVQWWAITAAGAGLAWWVWWRRRGATRGFQVATRANDQRASGSGQPLNIARAMAS
jgi:hypothetical protein